MLGLNRPMLDYLPEIWWRGREEGLYNHLSDAHLRYDDGDSGAWRPGSRAGFDFAPSMPTSIAGHA